MMVRRHWYSQPPDLPGDERSRRSLAASALGRIITPAKVAASRANGARRSLPCAVPSCGHSQRAHRRRGGCECGCPGYQRPE